MTLKSDEIIAKYPITSSEQTSQKLLAVREAINKACPWLVKDYSKMNDDGFYFVCSTQEPPHLADVLYAINKTENEKDDGSTYVIYMDGGFKNMSSKIQRFYTVYYPLTNDTPDAWSEELVEFLYEVLVDNK